MNDRIALALGQATLSKIVLESQVEQLQEQVQQRDVLIADLQAKLPDEGAPAPPVEPTPDS